MIAAAAAVTALAAGCGSTIQPSAVQTTAQVGGGLSVPTTTSSTAPPAITGPAPADSSGGGPSVVPTGGDHQAGSSTTPGGETTPTEGASTSSAPARTGPITVGFLTTATSNAASVGASLGNTISETSADQALINAINKHGGLDGRQLKVVFAHTDTGSSNWDNDFQAACATFTQDHHVDVVLGYQFTYEPDFEQCLARKDIPHLTDGFNVPSNATLAQYPLFWSLDVPTIGVRSIAKFEGAIKTGFLTPKDKLGVLIDNCPGTQQAWTSEVLPFLEAHHITVVPPFVTSCGTGDNAGTTSAVTGASSGLLKMRAEGVTKVSFVAVSEAPVLYIASIDAQTQGWHPGWIVSSLGQLAIIGGEAPINEMRNTRGFGWMPSQDVPPAYAGKPNAAQKRCLSLLRSQGVQPKSAADFGYAYNACEAVFLYEQALEADGGNTNGPAISNAIAGIGSSFQSTLNLDGRSNFTSGKRNNAPSVYKPINWDGSCHCFRYGHQTFSMPA